MPMDEYQALKEPSGPMTRDAAPSPKSYALAPPGVITRNAVGVDQTEACACLPPDTHGAIGGGHFLQVVNSRVVIWRKSDQFKVSSVPLNTFFGWPEFLFDPRAEFDRLAHRYRVTATRFAPAGDTCACFLFAISRDRRATAAYWIFVISVAGSPPGSWADFPQLGYDQDSFYLTHNWFQTQPDGSQAFLGTSMTSFSKNYYDCETLRRRPAA